MSRPVVIAVLAAVLALVGLTVTWFVSVPQPPAALRSAPTVSDERRQRTEDFFGGDPNRSVRDGQEMKPQW
ncbi:MULTISPECIES: entry exclusion protein TrbK [unclassified Mesorhizobium]|uniref:entry exclusion protein TrbK n=2 Tax=Mesorhizobium TaxID=68287 RepID=UPI001FDF5418|nr:MULTISPECIES: entry exclusion protein TrbK [unclassified Mesorhizobium]